MEKLKIHKFKILGGILALFLAAGIFFAGYLLGQRKTVVEFVGPKPTPETLATPTPEPTTVTSPKPSSTPVTIEKIPYKPIASWQTYTDSVAKFSVQYPYKKVDTSVPGKSVTFLQCLELPDGKEFCSPPDFRGISVHNDYDGGSRRVWFEKKRPNFLVNPYFQDVIVTGAKALIIMDGNVGGSTGSFALVPRGKNMYLFDFTSGWNPETKEKPGLDFIKQILSTFKFLD